MAAHCPHCGLVGVKPCLNELAAEDCPHMPGTVFEDGPLAGLKKWHYQTIVADPPWSYKTFSKPKEGTVPHRSEVEPYKTMTREELIALPVADLAAKDCVLHMWVISSHLDQALELGAAWGFTFKSLGLVWVKTCKSDPEMPKMGMGKWVRQETEIALIFTRGKPKRTDAGVRQAILEPAREHSRKPDESLDRFERLTEGPYLEMFSRANRPGWDHMGNQKGKFDSMDPVEEDRIASLV